MREGAALPTGASLTPAPEALPDAPLGLLLRPKWLTARARASRVRVRVVFVATS